MSSITVTPQFGSPFAVKPGDSVVVSSRYSNLQPATVAKVTTTQVVLADGRRFGTDGRQRGDRKIALRDPQDPTVRGQMLDEAIATAKFLVYDAKDPSEMRGRAVELVKLLDQRIALQDERPA